MKQTQELVDRELADILDCAQRMSGDVARFTAWSRPAAIIADSRLVLGSEGWHEMFGDTVPAWAISSARLVRDGVPVQVPTIVSPAPSAQWLAAIVAPLPGPSDAYVVACSELAGALARAQQINEITLAAVGHELRAPITSILLWEHALRDPDADDEMRARALDAIHDSTVAQSRVAADLVDALRALAGRLQFDLRHVRLDNVVRDTTAAIRCTARDRGVKVECVIGSEPLDILGDAHRLAQLLDNALENAVRFTMPGGNIRVTALRRGDSAIVEIEDNGLGIDEDQLRRMFDVFDTPSMSLGRRAGGLRLGLVIARHIAELHHGGLQLASEGRGHGTRLTLTIPIADRLTAPAPRSTVTRAMALTHVRILLIDDDARVREALGMLLTRAGANVARVESAESARAYLVDHEADLILCDLAMPGEDGCEFIRRLRASGVITPAIALTGHVSRDDASSAVGAGFDLHMPKPIDFDRLVTNVRGVLEARDLGLT